METARILVVDDDTALLVALQEALRLRMPEVVVDTCDSAPAALERLAATDYDALVSDIKMPGMDGLTLLTEVRQRRPDTPTLLITGHGQHDLAVQALRGGAFDFIQKPLDRDYFVASLSRAIRVRQMGRQIAAQQHALEQHAAQLEQAVDERTRELRDADRAKDEFLATLSHELRNPLASIRSAIELMALSAPDDPIRPEALEVAGVQVTNMARLLDDLLDISRITRHKITLCMKSLDLTDVIAAAVTAVGTAAEARRHRLVTRLAGGPLVVRGDRTRLEQVVVNLLTNAVRYTEPGGEIHLEAERHEGDAGQEAGGEPGHVGEAVVRVRDSGIGIQPEMLQRIFEPFVQADSPPGRLREGLGIGLALVHKLVEMHDGSIEVESEGIGRGSTFTLRLPLLVEQPTEQPAEAPPEIAADDLSVAPRKGRSSRRRSWAARPEERRPESTQEPAAIPDSGVPEQRPPVGGRRILLVDDNKSITYMTATLLREVGHEVVAVAHDGPSAIEAACAHEPEFVLLDIGLPGMDGYAVAQRLRQIPQLGGVVLVAMTGYGQEEDRRRSQEAGFDAHVTKPASVQTLQELFIQYGRRPLQQT